MRDIALFCGHVGVGMLRWYAMLGGAASVTLVLGMLHWLWLGVLHWHLVCYIGCGWECDIGIWYVERVSDTGITLRAYRWSILLGSAHRIP